MFGRIAEEESINMNFLEKASNLEGEDDLEILEEPPVRAIAPMAPPSKWKGVSTVLKEKKGGSIAIGGEKLMTDDQRTRSSKKLAMTEGNIPRKMKRESHISVGTYGIFGPGWNFA